MKNKEDYIIEYPLTTKIKPYSIKPKSQVLKILENSTTMVIKDYIMEKPLNKSLIEKASTMKKKIY